MRNIPEYLVEINDGQLCWIRKCPKCNNNIKHFNFASAKTCHKQKRLCYNCGCWNKGLTKETNVSIKNMALKVSKKLTEIRKITPPWNKGLTKETNDILKYIGNCRKGLKHTEEVKRKIGEYSKKLWNDVNYRNLVISKVKEIIDTPEHIQQWRLKMEQNGWFTPLELKSEFDKYKNKVWSYTRKSNISLLENHDKRGRSEYHLDHKYSITQGFLNNIPPEIIGSIHNLEMLYYKKNITKNSKCSITKNELLKKYYDDDKNKI